MSRARVFKAAICAGVSVGALVMVTTGNVGLAVTAAAVTFMYTPRFMAGG